MISGVFILAVLLTAIMLIYLTAAIIEASNGREHDYYMNAAVIVACMATVLYLGSFAFKLAGVS